MMKAWFVLLLLLPICTGGNLDNTHFTQSLIEHRLISADYHIECYGEDFLMVRNMILQCRSKVPQACYTRGTGEKGCVSLEFCERKGWKCCHENHCNA
nr:uncharacterized protein wu:fj16a03 isoform X1 [Misgurnus anguillicaudatus]